MNGDDLARDGGRRRGGDHAGNTDSPTARRAFTHWPLLIGDIKTRHGLTFVSSAEPGGFSVDDLRRIPDDGRRVELLKGVVVVRPPLTPGQQQLIRNLYIRLCDTCPKQFMAVERRDVRLGEATVFRPDVQVVPHDEDDGTFPEIVVELRPDDTDSDERRAKMHGYRDVGVPSYWIVNPEKARVAVYEIKYIKRDTLMYRCDEVCERAQRYRWRLWAGSA
jgi:Uma2 family endonuclease